ncbi:reverse transcriptase-like protein [Bacillus sp. 1P06AnD]|uniref:reverse transcriptase-like protein n=1 Tax=Bacillus sp. 1P06AnD TaxID=3132208 RepID=UPI0039A3259C
MKVYMNWTYKGNKKPTCVFHSDVMDAKDALAIAVDLEKTGRAFSFQFIDEQSVSWNKKELNKLLEEIQDEPQEVKVYFDAGYLKDEKRAGIGVIVYYKQNEKWIRKRVNKELEGLVSNNEAEYAAFYEGLCQLEELQVHHQTCEFFGDSQVVLNQLAGEWACLDTGLNAWLDRIEEKIRHLSIRPVYSPISRKLNKKADLLAMQALQGTIIDSMMSIEEKELL